MIKYGKFVIYPCGFDTFAIVAEYEDQRINLNTEGLNLYGQIIKTVHTKEKALRLVKKYERKMGRVK